MSRRVHDLSIDSLADLPEACEGCVFWELGGPLPGRLLPGPGTDPAAGRAAKEAWWQATQLEWGAPGKAVYRGPRMVGYALAAPARHLRGTPAPLPVSDDALLFATLWVDPGERGTGAAKLLLHAVLRESARRGAKALEAFGRRSGSGSCLLPEEALGALGFALHLEHPTFPLYRLELRQTVRWQESMGHAVESVVEALSRKERAPARPASRA